MDTRQHEPVTAIKIVRHNLYRPTSLFHETGHQAAHLTGWTDSVRRSTNATFAGDPSRNGCGRRGRPRSPRMCSPSSPVCFGHRALRNRGRFTRSPALTGGDPLPVEGVGRSGDLELAITAPRWLGTSSGGSVWLNSIRGEDPDASHRRSPPSR